MSGPDYVPNGPNLILLETRQPVIRRRIRLKRRSLVGTLAVPLT
jgi:hypothetical protein